MKIRIIYPVVLILSPIFGLIHSVKAQDANTDFINETVKKYKQHSSVSYDMDYSIKTFNGDEPLKMKRKCKLIRIPEDSIFGGIILYNRTDEEANYENFYDLKYVFFINHKEKKITRYDAHTGQKNTINGNSDGEVIKTYFLKPENLSKQINDKKNSSKLNDTIINDISFLSVKINFPDDEELSNIVKTILINRKTKNIEKMYYSVNRKDQIQKNAWEISNIIYDGFDTSDLLKSINVYKSKYEIKEYKKPTDEEMAPLANNTISPDFYGKQYPALKEISNKQFNGKIIILDFWHMACPPCIQAIPSLNSLYKKYKNDIIVLGLNPYDDDSKKIKKIPEFVERNNVTYPIVFINSPVLRAFNVKAFPTLYIIDKSGKIRNSHIGYSEKMEMELDRIISNLIKE